MFRLILTLLISLAIGVGAEPLSDNSLYNLPSQWSDQFGRSLSLEELRGKTRVLALIYTNCESVCPAIIEGMKATENKLSVQEKARVGFVLVSIDPSVDTSAKLKAYATEQKLGPAWTLLRGNPEDVRELAATLNFRYRKTSQKDYAHTAMITVLDGGGDVIHQHVGLTGGLSERLAAIRKALKAPK